MRILTVSTTKMNLDELDRRVVIKCFKEKRGFRTFVVGLYKYFDDVEHCNRYCKSLQKFLATSMAITSESGEDQEDNDNNDDVVEDVDDVDNIDNASGSDGESKKSKKKNKKDKKGKKSKKEVPKVINDPIYSFRGKDLIDKVKAHIIEHTTVPASEIKE